MGVAARHGAGGVDLEPPGSGLGFGCCWEKLEPCGAPVGLVQDVGGRQPRLSSDRRLMLGPGSPLLAPIKGFGSAGVSGSTGAAPRAQECGGSVGAHGGDPGGCGTGCGGSHPGGPTFLGVSSPSRHPLGCSQQQGACDFLFVCVGIYFFSLWE